MEANDDELMNLREYFDSYNMGFVNDFDSCIRAYNEPQTLKKYIYNLSKNDRRIAIHDYLKCNSTDLIELSDVIVENVRSKHDKHWIMVNAPMDSLLVEKLITEKLNPTQMVLFHDADPAHKVILSDNTLDSDHDQMTWEVIKNFKNGKKYEATVDRIVYPEFVNNIKNLPNMHEEGEVEEEEKEEDFYGEEFDTEEHDHETITHEYLMDIITPEIIKRINEYTDDLLKQWETLKINVLKQTNLYFEFSIIEYKPNSKTNAFKIFIEDTLYHIKK